MRLAKFMHDSDGYCYVYAWVFKNVHGIYYIEFDTGNRIPHIYIAAWCLVFNSVLKLIITILKCSVYGGSLNPKGHLHGSYDPGFEC